MNVAEILTKYPNLPQKFLVSFALYCANSVKHLLPDKRSLKAIKTSKLWLEDKVSKKDVQKAFDDANVVCSTLDVKSMYYINYNAANTACYAVKTAKETDDLILAARSAYHAFVFASNALNIPPDKYRDKLLEMIDELTDLEKLIYLK